MDFAAWTRALAEQGLTVVPPSHPAPIDLWALLPDGGAVRFHCRGTTVTLDRYDDTDLFVTTPPGACGCGCGARATPPPAAGRFAVHAGAVPVRRIRWDGAAERGWSGYEAGLLDIAAGAQLFETLYGALRASSPPVQEHSGTSGT